MNKLKLVLRLVALAADTYMLWYLWKMESERRAEFPHPDMVGGRYVWRKEDVPSS
jgi:hypothetical protein